MLKMIFSDIDGTFLVDDRRVSPATGSAVRALLARGLRLALVSARMPEAITPLTRSIGVTIPIISYSGAYVLDETGRCLMDRPLAADTARRLLTAIEHAARQDAALTVNYYAGHHWYVLDAASPRIQKEAEITSAVPEECPAGFASLIDAGTLPDKLLLMAEPAACAQLEQTLAAKFPACHVVRSSPFLLEIMDRTVSKATGIDVLLAHYGIAREETLSFGDNYNDLEMLRCTGESVAMGNAPTPIQKAATYVTARNTEDGFARYLLSRGLIPALDAALAPLKR